MEIIATFLLNERKPHVHGGIGRVGVPEVDDFDAINASRQFHTSEPPRLFFN